MKLWSSNASPHCMSHRCQKSLVKNKKKIFAFSHPSHVIANPSNSFYILFFKCISIQSSQNTHIHFCYNLARVFSEWVRIALVEYQAILLQKSKKKERVRELESESTHYGCKLFDTLFYFFCGKFNVLWDRRLRYITSQECDTLQGKILNFQTFPI